MNGVGRPLKINNPSQILAAWEEYKIKCDRCVKYEVSAGKVLEVPTPRIYTLGTFQVILGLTRESWREYKQLPLFNEVITSIEGEVLARKADALVNAEGSTAGLRFDLSANYNWQEKQSIDQKVQITSVEVKVLPAIDSAPIPTSEREVEI